MKKFSSLLLLLFLIVSVGYGQNRDNYIAYVQMADSLYDAKDYLASAAKYKAAFDELDGKAMPNDRYNAACSYALAKDVENAFYHLTYLADHPKVKYNNLGHISTDPDLNILHDDDRWEKLLATVKANKEEYEKDLDKPLVALLDTIYMSDQGLRREIGEVEEQYGRNSNEMKAHWDKIRYADSVNLIKVKEILDARGWLGSNVVGGKGNTTLFLVIQHSDQETQEKYLPMMREAVKNGNARGSSLALLEDRVALGKGEKQVYGSQIGRDEDTGEYYVLPMIEPEKVNERRASVGLSPIENYLTNWNFEWDVEKHKARNKE